MSEASVQGRSDGRRPVLELDEFAVRTTEGWASSPLSFQLETGSCVLIAGATGSGKSMIFERLAGVQRPGVERRGRVRGARPALLPQDARLAALPTDTVWTVLGLPRFDALVRRVVGFGKRRSERELRLERMLERLGVDFRRVFDLPFAALAGGERRCVILAAALQWDPPVLLFDAWDEVGDPGQRRRIRGELERHRALGMAVVIASRRFPSLDVQHDLALELSVPGKGEQPAVPLLPKEESLHPHESALMGIQRLSVARRQLKIGRNPPPAWVVDGATFYVRHGECLALLGPAGSGKTSLLHTIAGLGRAVGGVLTLEEHDVTSAQGSRARRLRRDVQLVFQNANAVLDDHRSVRAHLEEAAGLRHSKSEVAHWLDLVGIPEELADQPAVALSSAQAQRLDLARSLLVEPKLILWDSPESAAASLDGGVLATTVLRQKRKEQSFVLGTNDPELAAAFADRVAIMLAGRIIEFGPKKEILEAPAHPATRAFLAGEQLELPNPRSPARGCPHVKHCPRRQLPLCDEKEPMLAPLASILHPEREAPSGARRVACFFPEAERE